MSELSNLIFGGEKHYLSSLFGPRKPIATSNGKTSAFHSGADYATYGKKLPQFAVADGTILDCGVDEKNGGALYVWVAYPSLGVKMLHFHLSEINVSKGKKVVAGTNLGRTGATGNATGIHLHLGIKPLDGGDWIDPEEFSKTMKLTKRESASFSPGNYKVDCVRLNVRRGAGLDFRKRDFFELSKNAKEQVFRLAGRKVDGYVKGVVFSVGEVRESDGFHWGKTPSGWVALEYCQKVG